MYDDGGLRCLFARTLAFDGLSNSPFMRTLPGYIAREYNRITGIPPTDWEQNYPSFRVFETLYDHARKSSPCFRLSSAGYCVAPRGMIELASEPFPPVYTPLLISYFTQKHFFTSSAKLSHIIVSSHDSPRHHLPSSPASEPYLLPSPHILPPFKIMLPYFYWSNVTITSQFPSIIIPHHIIAFHQKPNRLYLSIALVYPPTLPPILHPSSRILSPLFSTPAFLTMISNLPI